VQKVVRSVCQACHCECGVLVHVQAGRVKKIKGDPDHPMNRGFVCIKGRAQPELLYHPDRVIYPMKRAGERGSGLWKRISWHEALEGISQKLTALKEKYGPESFCAIHGTGPRPTHYSTALLSYALGSPNVASTDFHICFVPSVVAGKWTMGHCITLENGPDYRNANCILVVGGNPLASHPPRGLDLLEAKKNRGAKLIVVDPHRTEIAERADLWLKIRPGTDLALVLGMIGFIIEDGLYDKEFVEKWCYGFDALRQRAMEYPLNRVEEISWIPADMIKEAARMCATIKPAVLHHRVAVEHNINSTQTCRALAIMIALSGNIDVRGGNVFPVSFPGHIRFGHVAGESRRFRPAPGLEEKRVGAKEYPLISGPDAVLPFVAAPLIKRAILERKPYPIKSMFSAGGNPVLNMQNARSVWTALKEHLELLVVADFFMTPTAELADYVLPPATWMERDEICDALYPNYIAARQRAVEPVGESFHDLRIAIELAKRIPWANRNYMPWDSVGEFNESCLKNSGLSFRELRSIGIAEIPMKYRKYENGGFHTPTGKVELYSTMFEKYGYDPLPSYREPPESPVSTPELFEQYPYILYTGNRHVEFFHSEGRQIKSLREKVPYPLIEIHPLTAARENIHGGEWVWIETPQRQGEKAKMKVKITDRVDQRMVHARHGWWFPEKPGPEHGCFEPNINVVTTDDPPLEEICASARTRGTLCKIYK